tara:strand:+ start:1520 stop:2191 length:672 start_codon:yes stop_codon:yes gene_type:complete
MSSANLKKSAIPSIGIINMGISNVKSIQYLASKLQYNSTILSSPSQVTTEKILVLPGVGSFDAGVSSLKAHSWPSYLIDYISDTSNAIIGICLGMQLMFEGSQEGDLPGLGLLPGRICKLSQQDNCSGNIKLPHIGWKYVDSTNKMFMNSDLSSCLHNQRFYFVHSYAHFPVSSDLTLATCDHGVSFSASVCSNNIIGFQFHPEKSHRYGLSLMSTVFSSVLQ